MEEYDMPFENVEELEHVKKDAQEINIAQILSCSQRTIQSYVDRGILPQPITVKNGFRYFLKEDVMEALGLMDMNEVLITPKEAAIIMKISHSRINQLIKQRIFTVIKLKGQTNAKTWLLKRETEMFDIEIDEVIGALEFGKRQEFMELFFTKDNEILLEQFVTKQEVRILKSVLNDKLDYYQTGSNLGLNPKDVKYLFYQAIKHLRGSMGSILAEIKLKAKEENKKEFKNDWKLMQRDKEFYEKGSSKIREEMTKYFEKERLNFEEEMKEVREKNDLDFEQEKIRFKERLIKEFEKEQNVFIREKQRFALEKELFGQGKIKAIETFKEKFEIKKQKFQEEKELFVQGKIREIEKFKEKFEIKKESFQKEKDTFTNMRLNLKENNDKILDKYKKDLYVEYNQKLILLGQSIEEVNMVIKDGVEKIVYDNDIGKITIPDVILFTEDAVYLRLLNSTIFEHSFNAKSLIFLYSSNIKTIRQLLMNSETDLMKLKGFGISSLTEVNRVLKLLRLKLRGEKSKIE